MTTTDTKPKPSALSLLGNLFKGNKTRVSIKESKDIIISIEGIPQRIAIKNIKNLLEELINVGNSRSSN